MTSDPEEAVRLQGYGEMTLRTAVTTLMTLPARDRSDATVFRIRDASKIAPREINALASEWGIQPTGDVGRDERPWTEIVRGMVREAPLPSLMVAFMAGLLVARR
jgi:hypothetical protein